MEINRKDVLIKLRNKNLSNKRLVQAIDQLITDVESYSVNTFGQLLEIRKDADKVHNAGFYFFDIHLHRILILMELVDNSITVVWTGSHEEYVSKFKNNKNTIEKWLKSKRWID
jgi:mRNA interferase HigB